MNLPPRQLHAVSRESISASDRVNDNAEALPPPCGPVLAPGEVQDLPLDEPAQGYLAGRPGVRSCRAARSRPVAFEPGEAGAPGYIDEYRIYLRRWRCLRLGP